ncbi:MAG: hypothetical protein IJU66_06710 [Oscillospiraceae bacterium]|nr:hypothetical protein [Oscillospiraceae bacterium]
MGKNEPFIKWAAVIAAVLVFALAAVRFDSCRGADGYGAALHLNWGFELPREGSCQEVFHADSSDGFHGDGLRCHIYACAGTRLGSMYGWLAEDRETIFHDSMSGAAEDWLEQLNVPAEWRPRCDDCLYWYQKQEDNSELLVFWDEGRETLCILESFL